jgi:mono/diheme cytochrome c family protein
LPFRYAITGWVLAAALYHGVAVAQTKAKDAEVPRQAIADNAASAQASSPARFVGSKACQQCHAEQYQAWSGSDHHHAFAQATDQTVKGNFDNVEIDYVDGKALFSRNTAGEHLITLSTHQGLHSYTVEYTLGHYPLQQYILETEPGRYQVFALAWDTRTTEKGGQRWIEIQPDEAFGEDNPFHWTGYFQNWNSQCADCHTTNYEKGFVATTDAQAAGYQSQWSEVGVGCEACHGPASLHVEWAGDTDQPHDNGLLTSMLPSGAWQFQPGKAIGSPVEKAAVDAGENTYLRTCARCHSLRHPIGSQTFEHVPGDSEHSTYTDHYFPQLVSEPLYYGDGQIREEVFVYGSFLQSKMHNAGVTCGNCHDPHSGKVKGFDADNIDHPGNDAVCAQCHRADVYAVQEHHQHPTDSEAARCVTCHMPETTYLYAGRSATRSQLLCAIACVECGH